MKIEVQSKKGLRTILSVIVDKKNIQNKMDERLRELQKEVSLKGFRPGKVPPEIIKSQFGKSIYGEVVDKILRETSSKAINEKKLKVAGQPKIAWPNCFFKISRGTFPGLKPFNETFFLTSSYFSSI